jgi:hypothetical protein
VTLADRLILASLIIAILGVAGFCGAIVINTGRISL